MPLRTWELLFSSPVLEVLYLFPYVFNGNAYMFFITDSVTSYGALGGFLVFVSVV